MILIGKGKSLLNRLRKPKKLLIVTGTLPCLKSLSDYLSLIQFDDGSWSNDILTTALALQALVAYSKATKEKCLKEEIKRGKEFLKGIIESLSNEVLQTEELYSDLDRIAIEFSNAFYALWPDKSLGGGTLYEKTLSAFLKIEDNVAKSIKALDNIEVACSILKCHIIPSLPSFPDDILNFVISKFFLEDIPPRDAFLIISTFQTLRKRFSSTLEEKWKYQVSRRMDTWRDTSLEKALEKLTINKFEEMVKSEMFDIASLSYCLMVMNQLSVDNSFKKEIIQRIMALCDETNILKDKPPLSELSLLIRALAESPISKIAFFPLKESSHVNEAVRWFEKMKTRRIKMLEVSQYNLLIVFCLILICLTVIMSYLAFSNIGLSIAVSVLLSTFYFVINRLSKAK